MPHNSNGRHRSGDILALVTSSLLLAACTALDRPALDRPDCADWNTVQFFEEATAADVGRCLSQGADPNARDKNGGTPTTPRPTAPHDGWPQWLWDRAPNYRSLTPAERRAILVNTDIGRERRQTLKELFETFRRPALTGGERQIPADLGVFSYDDGVTVQYNEGTGQFEPHGGWKDLPGAPGVWERWDGVSDPMSIGLVRTEQATPAASSPTRSRN